MDNADARYARLEMELRAIDNALAEMRYLGYGPATDTWLKHCRALDRKLAEALDHGEYWLARKS